MVLKLWKYKENDFGEKIFKIDTNKAYAETSDNKHVRETKW